MSAQNILNKIKAQYPAFSKSQKLIADYILKDFNKAVNMTAARLGEIVCVSESTVVRFAVELGYAGYPEFTDALLEYLRSKSSIIKRMEAVTATLGVDNRDILCGVINSDINNLKSVLLSVDGDAFNNAVDALISAGRIYILGIRSSSCLASFLGFYLNFIFDNVKLVHSDPISEISEQILRIKPGDVLFGISFPRYSRRVVKALKFAKERGAVIVTLTDTEKSPLVPFSDCLITVGSEDVSFVDSLVAPMAALNALIAAVVIKKKDEAVKAFRELENLWDEQQVYNK
jgi:DNA-binding MurR/RpiR family transcriptional regulator